MFPFFNKTSSLIKQLDRFIHMSNLAIDSFTFGIENYLLNNSIQFNLQVVELDVIEKDADSFKKEIESRLYVHTLIPESRGDVLGILENMDIITDWIKSAIMEFSIEKPEIPEDIKDEFLKLVKLNRQSVLSLVEAVTKYFYDISYVPLCIYKVEHYENQSDRLSEKIMKSIFSMNISIDHKIHLTNFVKQIDKLSDIAEDVSHRLYISAIKRTI